MKCGLWAAQSPLDVARRSQQQLARPPVLPGFAAEAEAAIDQDSRHPDGVYFEGGQRRRRAGQMT
jgi:hypothetical protein